VAGSPPSKRPPLARRLWHYLRPYRVPFAIALACFGMGLTFEEALVGATLNAAYSLDRHARVGSLEPGKQMDAVVVDGPAIDLIRVGAETIAHVIKKGRLV